MGEVEQTPWEPEKTYRVPKIIIESPQDAVPFEESILDYMGVPTKIFSHEENRRVEINALPVRAYVKIWNEFFRDQNVGNAALFKTDDEDIKYRDDPKGEEKEENTLLKAIAGGRCLPVSKFHDYFTSCLPYPQRGPEVAVGIAGKAPVRVTNVTGEDVADRIWLNGIGGATPFIENNNYLNNPVKNAAQINGASASGSTDANIATLATDLSNVSGITINQLRQAFAVQHYYEALARGGSRYREQVRAIFGVSISDKTVQVPEYLGGGRYHVNINQIVQTSGQQTANDTPIGETGAMSVTPINESSFTKSFEEHGFVIGVMCVRHNRSYQQGLERFWSRSDRLDFYFPQFANIGEQPVKKKEIMLTGTSTDNETFGYQEAWADYRMKPDRVSGKMRSNADGTLDFWHYADKYDKVPTLSQEWMSEGKTEIARTLIVQDEPQFFGAIRVMNNTTRCIPLYSVPGLEKL
jgi:hypothetical protein